MKKAENTGNYIDISFSNKRNNVFLLLLYKSYYLNLVTFAVAPPVGAWIEISERTGFRRIQSSLPPWERGLKSVFCDSKDDHALVAPPVGAWIEIKNTLRYFLMN